ncbi:MAG: hypothetical protein ABIO37_17795, partial [Caulobacteraceae bacterium]
RARLGGELMARGSIRSNPLHLALLALALAVRIVVPVGFMPSMPASGGFPLILCTGQGTVVITVRDPLGVKRGPADAPSDRSAHDGPCVFSGFAPAPPPAFAVTATTVEFASHQLAPVAPPTELTPGRGLAAPPPPARGPPLIS